LGKQHLAIAILLSQIKHKATIQLGITTTTDDLEGEIITSQPVSELSLEAVRK